MTKFVADSSCDLQSLAASNTVSVPLTIYSDDFSYTDDPALDIHGMLDVLSQYKSRSYTACPSVDGWLQAFEGADTVYAATITSGLSGTYNSAMAARDIYLQSHPEARIHIFDTLSTGPEPRLLMEKLMELDTTGLDFDEVCWRAEEYQKSTRLFFSLRSLHNMAQNGRVSKVIASAVGILNLCIIATASPEGVLSPIAKARGEKRALAKLVEQVEEAGYRGGKLRISHVENPALAESLKTVFLAAHPEADIKVYPANGLCSYYAERGGVLIGMES